MKRSSAWRVLGSGGRLATVLTVALTCGCGAPVQSDDAPLALRADGLAQPSPHVRHDPNPQLFDVDSYPYGISMLEWSENWLRWEYSIPAASNPQIVAGASYDQHQIGPVYFVPVGPNHDDAFTVPREKSVAVMLSQIGNDYPCPDPTFEPAPGQSLFAFLSDGLTTINDDITVLDVTLDGVAIADPLRYRYTSSRLFYFIGDKSLTASFDACVTGTLQPTVADDLFIILKPLSRGTHTLTTHIVNTDGGVFDRTRTITSD